LTGLLVHFISVISVWTVLTVLWIGFCHTWHISLYFAFFCQLHVLYYFIRSSADMANKRVRYCNTVRWTWWDWNLIRMTLFCFSASTLLGHLTR